MHDEKRDLTDRFGRTFNGTAIMWPAFVLGGNVMRTDVGRWDGYLSLAVFPGDSRNVGSAIIASAEQSPAPQRLTLGSDAYALVHSTLTGRLAALEAQKALA